MCRFKPLIIFAFFLVQSKLALAQTTIPSAIGPQQTSMSSVVPPSVNELPAIADMPDPLISSSGAKITDTDQWDKRRAEIKKLVEYYAVGDAPPSPGNVVGKELAERPVLNGEAICHAVHLSFGPDNGLGFDLFIFVPKGTSRFQAPFPTCVQPTFNSFFNKGINQSQALWEKAAHDYDIPLSRGYAVATFYYQQAGADKFDGLYQTGFFREYPGYDWADLAAWAWAMSRCVDYLSTQVYVDTTKFIAVGHSRIGKATLVAGAFDDRFALTAPCGSGCSGTGAYRFNGPGHGDRQGLDDITQKFPQWFCPNLRQFATNVDRLPFDEHWLIAMTAPRLFISAEGLSDTACTGIATEQSFIAAKSVFTWLGVPDNIGINFRPGGHMLAPDDWTAILDFADQHLRHINNGRTFDDLPSPDQIH
jgi:hypothetical protein